MKNISIRIVGLIFCFILFASWSMPNKDGGALISISARTKGTMEEGYGIVLTLMNLETRTSYKTKSLGPISPHSIIRNLPQGKYFVSKIEIPLGGMWYTNRPPELRDYFGVLEFEENKKYYLGNFFGVREAGMRNVLYLKIESEDIPDKLLVKLKKKGFDSQKENFIKTYPYSKEKLLIY